MSRITLALAAVAAVTAAAAVAVKPPRTTAGTDTSPRLRAPVRLWDPHDAAGGEEDASPATHLVGPAETPEGLASETVERPADQAPPKGGGGEPDDGVEDTPAARALPPKSWLQQRTVEELRSIAQQHGVTGRHRMTKAQLVDALADPVGQHQDT